MSDQPVARWTVDGSGPFTVPFEVCQHADLDIERGDASVGIFESWVLCNDCGAVAVEDDSDVVLDEEGMPQQVGSGAPVWQAPQYQE